MEVLFIDENFGDPELTAFSDSYQKKLLEHGGKVTAYSLRELEIKQCTGCSSCMYRTPGRCVFKDDQEKVLQDLIHSDVVVILAPLCRGFIHSMTKRFLDRLYPLETPWIEMRDGRMHHQLRYDSYPKLGFIFHGEEQTTQEDIEINKAYVNLVGDYYTGHLFSRTTEDEIEVLVNETVRV